MSSFALGVDIGGTFTDLVSVDQHGAVLATKTASTPPDFERGFLTGVHKLAAMHGISPADLLAASELVLHGTTVATNALVELRGARVGMLTTAGHRDTVPVMRASGRVKGLPADAMLRASRHDRPRPVVTRELIVEIDERIDARGEVVVALDEHRTREAVRGLLAAGVEAIAICLLWSIVNPAHERRVRELVREQAADAYVTCSHEVSARAGEYERFAATAINAFLGPETAGYMRRLRRDLDEAGSRGRLLIMQASGGVATEERAAELPVLTIGSGPSAGAAASALLADRRGEAAVIATDMGGTSFDVALVADGDLVRSSSTVVNQYEFFLPRTDIRSIGSGGGSVIWHDPRSDVLRVGPLSAGADPGPVCYGRGGERPTVTDANLLLGYLNPSNFLGGEITLDQARAEQSLAAVGAPLGMSAEEVALSARRIVEAQMADLIRQMTVERGMDPRDFVLYAYGGAAGLHVAGYARELGCSRAVAPLGALSATWSAFGCATSDILHVAERALTLTSPFDMRALADAFAELESEVDSELAAEGIPADRRRLSRSVEMKYPLQIHVVEVAPPSLLGDDAGALLAESFAARYEQLYGEGSAFQGAGTQIVGCRVLGRGLLPQPEALAGAGTEPAAGGAPARRAQERRVIWLDAGEPRSIQTPVMSVDDLGDGSLEGPAIVEGPSMTIAVPPGHRAAADGAGNLVLTISAA